MDHLDILAGKSKYHFDIEHLVRMVRDGKDLLVHLWIQTLTFFYIPKENEDENVEKTYCKPLQEVPDYMN